MPNKSLVMGKILIPDKYFFDYLRGYFDGDGSFYSYKDSRWRSSYMYYISFASGSLEYIKWLQSKICLFTNCKGHITFSKRSKGKCYQLKFAKKEATKIISLMYQNTAKPYLQRKYLKIKRALAIVGQCL